MTRGVEYEFLTDPNEVLRLLTKSKDEGTAIGISSAILGAGTYVTCVDEIISDSEIIVVIKPYDATGRIFDRCRLNITEIKSMVPFSSNFTNPFYKNTQFNNTKV